MRDLPILNIKLEGLANSLNANLMLESEEIQAHVDATIKAIASEDGMRQLVDTAIREKVKETIKAYFSYGAGAQAIQKSVFNTLEGNCE